MLYDCPRYIIEKAIDITSLTSIHYFEFDDTFTDFPESHEPWELVYVDRGQCNVVAGEKTLLLKQGEMYFHKPHENHMLKTIKGVAPNVFIIVFSSPSPAMSYFENKKIAASMATKQHIAAIIHEASSTFDLPFNNPQMQELRPKSDCQLWGGQQTILLRLELMLIEIIRSDPDFVPETKMFCSKEIITDEFVLNVISFLEERLYGKITIEEISHKFAFSKTYISKQFIKVCGHSIIDYFNLMKINEAKRLIRETNHNFFEISEMLMFSNSHYFSNMFKKHTGMTPTQYKHSCRKK
ncbi:MAG: helix-turn-helix transcriptional regulator [Clostridia bacterium]|nr:helix-turn-helix transcriptional regulator [Clostridia bacterium]